MRRKLLYSTLLVSFSSIFLASYFQPAMTNPEGSPNARTGSPGDNGNTCAISGCHTGTAVTTRAGLISSNIPQEGYTAGSKYTFTLTANSSPNRNVFGFQFSPQTLTGVLVGSMTVTNSSTKLTGASKYMTHTQNGIQGSNGQKTWTFDWTAPAAGTGDVTFYACFNYANGDGSTPGDSIIKSTFVASEKVSIGIEDVFSKLGFTVYPNPSNNHLTLLNSTGMNLSAVKIYNMQGALVLNADVANNAKQIISIDELPSGIYFLALEHEGNRIASRKIVKQ